MAKTRSPIYFGNIKTLPELVRWLTVWARGVNDELGILSQEEDVVEEEVVEAESTITDWTAYTPTGSWVANTTYTGFWRLVGDTMEINAKVATSGNPTSTPLTIDLPTGYTIDTAKITGTSLSVLGFGVIDDPGNSTYSAIVVYNSATSLTIYSQNDTATYAQVEENWPMVWAAGDFMTIRLAVPVA